MSRALARYVPLLLLAVASAASAQTPADPSNYARTTSFTYNADGTLKTTTAEPDNAPSCHVTTIGYDAYGNVNSSVLSNCTGASGTQLFNARPSGATFAAVASQNITTGGSLTPNAQVAVVAGLAKTSASNALTQSTQFEVDPRFGVTTKTTDIDLRVTQTVVDDFGRPLKQIKPDGTSVRNFYCVLTGVGLDTSSNTAGCATTAGADVPPYAVRFTQTEPHDVSDTKNGPFVRTYFDRLNRTIRTVTESFDGDSQPAARKGVLIVSDVVYDANGAKSMETKPYFLASGSTTVAGTGDVGVTFYVYDALGRTTTTYVSDPDATTHHQWTFGGSSGVSYGVYGTRTVSTTATTFAGTTNTITNDLGQIQVAEHDARDQLTRKTDANGAQLAFQYDAFGNAITIVDALQNKIQASYDIVGAKVLMNDPDHGVLVYCFDAAGQLKAQQSSGMRKSDSGSVSQCPTDLTPGTVAVSKANWATFAYDQLGRTTNRVEPDLVSTWTFDSCANGVGELCKVVTSSGATKTYGYDVLGRLVNTRIDVAAGPSFASAVAFDSATGRLQSKIYPTGLQVGYGYTPLGFAQKLQLNNAATVTPLPDAQGHVAAGQSLPAGSTLWSATTVDAESRWQAQAFGNGVAEAVSQNPSNGRIWSRTASVGGTASVLNQAYTWDGVNNVRSRTDNIGAGSGAITEAFNYDALNRLSGYSVSSPGIPNLERDVTLQFNAVGMLLSKSDAGNYTYGAAGTRHAHALVSNDVQGATYGVDWDGNVTSATAGHYSAMSYTSFDSVSSAQGSGSTYGWIYDESHGRIQETRTSNGDTRVTWYLNPDNAGALAFEVETDTSPAAQNNRHYLTANGNVIGLLVTAGSLPTLSAGQMSPVVPGTLTLVKIEYWHKDHLGSLAATTDHLGGITARYSYDPFGKRRYTDGRYDATGQVVADWSPSVNYGTARGFTGHEQLDDIGIVNMNGRLYDATLGMFVQADPHVTIPDNLQGYNRYAYVLNNPLNATDPTGFDGTTNDDNKKQQSQTAHPPQEKRNSHQVTYLSGIFSYSSGNSNDSSDGATTNQTKGDTPSNAYMAAYWRHRAEQMRDLSKQPVAWYVTFFGIDQRGEWASQAETFDRFADVYEGKKGAVAEIIIKDLVVPAAAAYASRKAFSPPPNKRLPQDIAVNPKPPAALPTGRAIGTSPTQNAEAQRIIAELKSKGYTDIRVNQHQVNADGVRVGVNRPDIQATSPGGQRVYFELDRSSSTRGADHETRINANDPQGKVVLKTVN